MQPVLDYLKKNEARFISELCDYLRFPSVSAQSKHKKDLAACANWLVKRCRNIGLETKLCPTEGNPIVVAKTPRRKGARRPHFLVYGHYDVQPAEPFELWKSPPFEPRIEKGRVYARGSVDNKGQHLAHLNAVEAYLKTGTKLPCNLTFVIEGEEEVSSPNLVPFLKEHLELLRADVCVISDSSMRSIDEPAILHSLRGMTYAEIEVHGPSDDLHSGLWGGAVHNPALALVEILGKLYNPDNTIAIPGFYDDVVPLTPEEREMIAKTDLTEAQYKQSTGVPAVWGDANYNIRERISARPTLDINGLWSGWSGPGPKTIVPARAGCKISSRLVGNQDAHKIFDLLKSYVESITPPTVTVDVRLLTTGKAALFPFDIPEMQAAARAYEKGWGAKPIFTRGGGSIPVVAEIADLMDIPVVMMGYGLDDDGLHSPNERFSIEMFHRGIETAIVYLEELALLTDF